MNQDENDDLWRLLGKAPALKASPYFSRNVLCALRAAAQEQPGVIGWLRRRWQFVALTACACLLLSIGLISRTAQPDQITLLAQEVSASPDYAVISHLDELLASEESSVWLDNSVY